MTRFLLGVFVGMFVMSIALLDSSGGSTRHAKFSCQSGDSFLTRKKYLCTEAEFKTQRAPSTDTKDGQ